METLYQVVSLGMLDLQKGTILEIYDSLENLCRITG